jgi:rhamnosyltransferase
VTSFVSVIIPTLNAAPFLEAQLEALRSQTVAPDEIIVIDSDSSDATRDIAKRLECTVIEIKRPEFNHGGTRNRAAREASGDYLVFMTQDALPVNRDFLRKLIEPLQLGQAEAAYARQIAYPHATPPERLARNLNYPSTSHITTKADIPRQGLKAFFFSNVASVISKSAFDSVDGFPTETIMNEDMLICSKLLKTDRSVAYVAEAMVFHSHNYRLTQQFKRNFDIGAFISEKGAILGDTRAGKSGIGFAYTQVRTLFRDREFRWIPAALIELGVRFLGFRIGRRQYSLPIAVKRRLSMHAFYWTSNARS